MTSHLVLIVGVVWVALTPALATAIGRALRSGGAVPVESSARDESDRQARDLADAGR